MKVLRIISIIEQYGALKSRLQSDIRDYETYKVLEPDEKQEEIARNKVMYDYDEIGKFLDMEV